jgi:hypothetical protein
MTIYVVNKEVCNLFFIYVCVSGIQGDCQIIKIYLCRKVGQVISANISLGLVDLIWLIASKRLLTAIKSSTLHASDS